MFNDSYTVVYKIKRDTKMESGLFRFLSQTKYHTLQDYILINLDGTNKLYDIVNMDSYVMSNRHISIDRYFVKPNTLLSRQKLLSHWHYTQEYRHPNKPPIKLHVYFNHALFLLACIHHKDDSFLKITDKFMLTKIRMNTYEAEQLVNGFLRELTN